jgi:hypothetical protein
MGAKDSRGRFVPVHFELFEPGTIAHLQPASITLFSMGWGQETAFLIALRGLLIGLIGLCRLRRWSVREILR